METGGCEALSGEAVDFNSRLNGAMGCRMPLANTEDWGPELTELAGCTSTLAVLTAVEGVTPLINLGWVGPTLEVARAA